MKTTTNEKNSLTYSPRVDLYESEKSVLILAQLPGVDENSIELVLENNELRLEGKVEKANREGYRLIHEEYPTGDFSRVFSLSNQVDEEAVEATIKNGVLRLELQKKAEVSRKIQVKAQGN